MVATPKRRRAVWLTLLALVVSPTAFAIDTGADPGPASLSVSTSLASCGLGGNQVICKLNVSYGSVPGASSYSATVTDANGTVTDYGAVGVGSTSLYVPYVGPGTYSVQITAYGTPPEPGGRGNVVATGTDQAAEATVSGARGNNVRTQSSPGSRVNHADAAEATPTETPGNAGAAQETGTPPAEATATPDSHPGDTAEPPPPAACPTTEPQLNPLPPDNDPNNDDEDGDGISDGQELAAAAAGSQLTLPAPPPPPGC